MKADVQPILQVKELYKRFGGLVAVDHVSLDIYPGEVVGLLGDNGAGKSTLIKMISGAYKPDGGQILLDGQAVSFATPLEARRRGIETIYQDLALCENLDASANIFLGRERMRHQLGIFRVLHRSYMLRESSQVLDQLDIRIPELRNPISKLSGGQRQAVSIARAVYWKARLMIMDEPTAAIGVALNQRGYRGRPFSSPSRNHFFPIQGGISYVNSKSNTTDARAGDTDIGSGWYCVDTAGTDADRGG